MNIEVFYFFIVFWPLLVACTQFVFPFSAENRRLFAIAGSAFYGIVVLLCLTAYQVPIQSLSLFDLFFDIAIKFRLDGLSAIFLFVVSLLWPAATIYGVGYLEKTKAKNQARFFFYFSLAIFATTGVILSANLLSLYVFYELLSLSTYPLVVHNQDSEAKKAGRKYLVYILGPSILFFLPAMIITFNVTGDLDFINQLDFKDISNTKAIVLVLLFIYGASKAALIPLHSWLPGAMVAPTPVSALLHAVAVVKVGVFSVLRIIQDVFGIEYLSQVSFLPIILCIIGVVSVLWPSVIALSQKNLKRRLAFSTIGQLAYITFGAFLLTKYAMLAAAAHIAMHAFAKITLFFAIGAIYVTHQKKYLDEIQGLAYKMPWTFTAIAIGSAGVVGLPLTGGLITKWHLLLGSFEVNPIIAIVFLLSSFLSAIYLFEIVFVGLKKEKTSNFEIVEAPKSCLYPTLFTAFVTIILFFISPWIFNFAFSWIE